ncbi:MAG TPA: tetratricopeptide repeat protein [Pyrinomonadaceae bacterium]|nr:tetratricopeptide repeat protein [Pyrinomonadaceae bacterium]
MGRLLLIGGVLCALVFGWFSVRWQLGNMLASLTTPNQSNSGEIAQLARSFAPGDALPMWLIAVREKENFSPESLEKSVGLFEQVVRLSPNDFRYWIELGRAYEQAEMPDKAEKALHRAVELAPTYTFPHWQFGNFYLRQNRSDEAFAELRKTTERSIVYREQVFSLAWDYFDKDPQKVEALAADTPDVRSTLALFYAARGSADNALRVWNTLTPEEKPNYTDTAKQIARGLFEKQRFRESLEFSRQTGIDPEAQFETVTNGGFEKFMGLPDETLFGWRVYRSEPKIDVLPDTSVKSEGTRSLRVTFRGYSKVDLHNVVQSIAVQPGGRYRLSFMLRTDNLRSGGPPVLQVISGPENKGIASSAPFEAGSADWKQMTVEFTVPSDFDSVLIRTGRIACAEECPIAGTIWYDDFRLSKL